MTLLSCRPSTRVLAPIVRRPWLQRHAITTAQHSFDKSFDVVIIGAGGAGLTAALRAKSLGLRPLVVEKDDRIGGSSAYSGAGLWVPNNSYVQAQCVKDNKEDALRYLESVVADVGPASSRERKLAFLDEGPKMVDFLRKLGFRWRCSKGVPDYYPNAPGALPRWGRTVEPDVFDLKKLGDWGGFLRSRPRQPPPIFTDEATSLTMTGASAKHLAKAISVVFRMLWLRLRGQSPVTMGQSLIAQLLHRAKADEIPVWRNAPLMELLRGQDGSVHGAKIKHEGSVVTVQANKGVLLCAGGFAHNKQMRDKFGPQPASTEWTSTPEGDTGDAIQAGVAAGAAVALMDEAWWGPTILDPEMGKWFFSLQERARPFSIIVDSTGSRFMNEAASYVDAGHRQYEHNTKVKAIPAWLILDQNHRQRYALGSVLPRKEPKKGLEAGYMHKADTLDALATAIGVNAAGLCKTIARFNDMAAQGVDLDFGRGDNAYDTFFGDPNAGGSNPNLGPIARPPFYAVPVVPGDLGTKGGLLTDHRGRVLREDGSSISGLYAAGNTSASIMGRTYPGAGSTLGPALTFAFIAATDMAQR
ncbi:extracellular 3-ketosteroid 1-dehydrogenase [Emericellopsis atlantica]|uniref:Extracellular 3-ketosteroid 1-dehydrogenase n=1 Tax=Emericellopsis atlantica TaxID=2614577 RepID=A0A9P8CJY7_9HYPO|nr:extracellular 3-ketosteroid 1-dehydrogenase [Emericellopsis atlantica]KAG9249492.1 extracellular 3-ketosteroid 1-dehydrogenase [Emericellopsis atlantica]